MSNTRMQFALLLGTLAASLQAQSQPMPRVIHFCAANCMTLERQGNGNYLVTSRNGFEPANFRSVWTFETFTSDRVVIRRHDSSNSNGDVTYTGSISPEGGALVHIVANGKPSPGMRMTWGTALEDTPGTNAERDRRKPQGQKPPQISSISSTSRSATQQNTTLERQAEPMPTLAELPVDDAGFETPSIGPCPASTSAPADTGWDFSPNAGITTVGCAAGFYVVDNTMEVGRQVALLHANGKTGPNKFSMMRQSVHGFIPGHAYRVKFVAAGGGWTPKCQDNCQTLYFSVFVGGIDVCDPGGLTRNFKEYTSNAFIAPESASITFTGDADEGWDESAFIDAVSVQDLGPAGNLRGEMILVPPSGIFDSSKGAVIDPSRPDASVVARSIPNLMVICIADKCTDNSEWNFRHKTNISMRAEDGARADLTLLRFDSGGVIVQRKDTTGLSAEYKGMINGNRITGEVVAHLPEGKVLTQKWVAIFGEYMEDRLAGQRAFQFMRAISAAYSAMFTLDQEQQEKEDRYQDALKACRTGRLACPTR